MAEHGKILRLAHLIDVRAIGGVERIYADFLACPAPWPVQHFTVADHPAIAPAIAAAIRSRSQVVSARNFVGLPVPRRPHGLRQHNRERLLRRIRPDLVLAWNQFTDYRALGAARSPWPMLYYEHGGAWYPQPSTRVDAFFARVDGVIAVSQAAKRMLQLKYGVRQPIDVCLNVPRPGALPDERQPREWPSGRPLILGCAGRLVPLKCMGLTVLIVKALRERGFDVEARIAGAGSEQVAVEALIARHGLQKFVRLLGLLDDMAPFYRDIDLCLSTSMHETFGLTCIEAAAWGVPVIAAAIDGLPEAVLDGRTGLCLEPTWTPGHYREQTGASIDFASLVYRPRSDDIAPPKILDPETVADAIAALAADPERYRRMSAQALAHVEEQNDFSAWSAALYRIIGRYLPAA